MLNYVQFFKKKCFQQDQLIWDFYSKGNFRDTFDKVNLTEFYMLKTWY